MSKSLHRLLALRERQKKAAEGALQLSFAQQRREQALVEAGFANAHPGGEPQRADVLQQAQAERDVARLRLRHVEARIAEQQLVLTHAKRELKQVERLTEKRAEQAQEHAARAEVREQEDWVRARAHADRAEAADYKGHGR